MPRPARADRSVMKLFQQLRDCDRPAVEVKLMVELSKISPTGAIDGACRLLPVDVDCYNVELKGPSRHDYVTGTSGRSLRLIPGIRYKKSVREFACTLGRIASVCRTANA